MVKMVNFVYTLPQLKVKKNNMPLVNLGLFFFSSLCLEMSIGVAGSVVSNCEFAS